MIICRTPFRISFFGGGTDYPAWYENHGGAVLSTTINKFCYITLRYLPEFFEYKHRIRYYQKEEVNTIDEIQHPSVRECLKFMAIEKGVEVVHYADLPALSGLGSSSTFTVCLLHAIYTLKHAMPTKRDLALNAIEIEQNRIKESVGSQDQTAAAFGGFNYIRFNHSSIIDVQPVVISNERLDELQSHTMLFFTGFSRLACEVAQEQIKNIEQNKINLDEMSTLTNEALKILYSKSDLSEFGRLLNVQWQMKRTLTNFITNTDIDQIYNTGIKAGALGGKLLGAGGGGFMLFFVEPEKQEQVKKALADYLYVPVRFDFTGSQIIYYAHYD